MTRKALLAAVAAMSCCSAEAGQYVIPYEKHVEAESGAPTLIAAFFNCRDHAPYVGTAFVQHGKITMKHVTINQCGNAKEPATAYWYVSEPGFKGLDEANFSYVSGSVLVAHITVR